MWICGKVCKRQRQIDGSKKSPIHFGKHWRYKYGKTLGDAVEYDAARKEMEPEELRKSKPGKWRWLVENVDDLGSFVCQHATAGDDTGNNRLQGKGWVWFWQNRKQERG
jgi:hypothetical protein